MYLHVKYVLRGMPSEYVAAEFAFDVMLVGFYVVEIMSIGWLTTAVQREGDRIGLELFALAPDMDVRLKESVRSGVIWE